MKNASCNECCYFFTNNFKFCAVKKENKINFQYPWIFKFWTSYCKSKINSIFHCWQLLKIGKNWIDWKLGKIQFSKTENQKKLIWPLGTQTFIQFTINFCLKLNWKSSNFNFQFVFSVFNFPSLTFIPLLFGLIFDKQKLKNRNEN